MKFVVNTLDSMTKNTANTILIPERNNWKMIEPGKIACHAYGKTVHSKQSKKSLLWVLSVDDAPTVSNIVTREHIKNRPLVSQGKIVSWGEHGRVAVLENSSGIQAAFKFYELNN